MNLNDIQPKETIDRQELLNLLRRGNRLVEFEGDDIWWGGDADAPYARPARSMYTVTDMMRIHKIGDHR